jgi:hypothetical protein
MSNLSLNEPSKNPWQSAMDSQNYVAVSQPPQPPNLEGVGKDDPWAEPVPRLPPKQMPDDPAVTLSQLNQAEEPGWDEVSHGKAPERAPPPPPPPGQHTVPDELVDDHWDDLGLSDKAKGKAPDLNPGQAAQIDDWNLIDVEPSGSDSGSRQAANTDLLSDTYDPPAPPSKQNEDDRPALPPRNEAEGSRWVPTRQPVDGSTETYQIKNIQWHDATSSKNPRTSPILVQNANGPCPLVALVNALTLTTPADETDTALVHVLRSREQVSLNLLLDAVFDELMSPRRTGSEDALPDVSDLYAFLQSLHTGMNVNPRFYPTPQMVDAYKRTSLTHLDPSERAILIPGTFENTHEMSLYAAFSIPLIHGWLPSQADPVYAAMERHAASYEDVQNLLFREEELEAKLSSPGAGLSESEQELYQDIMTIRSFLSMSATQLTPWGIEVISKAIRPGTFAILFRNDHFSTLYCHPQTMQLFTLVTDAGYHRHEDVVWESLVDVNGERTEFFSGNFRVVAADGRAAPSEGNNQGGEWSTAQSNSRGKAVQNDEGVPEGSSREQEDRDLALALQLQEEEDQRHREEEARRRQERLLSEQFIEQQAQPPGERRSSRSSTTPSARNARAGGEQPTAARRSSNTVNVPVTGGAPAQEVRPLLPPRRTGMTTGVTGVSRRPDEGGEDAPPSYEQASQAPKYEPPRGHPNHSNSNAASRQTTRTSTSGAGPSSQQPAPLGRRPGPGGNGAQNKDRDCVVM